MNSTCETSNPLLCDCCTGVSQQTPQSIYNRPALSSINYRVGEYSDFYESMLAALAATAPGLKTRDSSDFSIALLDTWALTADILSFYQERIANECYLRTAQEQRSVFELARLVGYLPSPGVAASTYLAFNLNPAPGAPDNVVISAGLRVQSVPGPGQSPAIFETSAPITARIAYNAIPVQTTVSWCVNKGDTISSFKGVNLNLHPGDGLLFINDALRTEMQSGTVSRDLIDTPDDTTSNFIADFHIISTVQTDSLSGSTRVSWDQPLADVFGTSNSAVSVYVMRKKASLFGAQAPDPQSLGSTTIANKPSTGDWAFVYDFQNRITLDAIYNTITAPNQGEPQTLVLVSPSGTALYQITGVSEYAPVRYALSNKATQLSLANGIVLLNKNLYTSGSRVKFRKQSKSALMGAGSNISNIIEGTQLINSSDMWKPTPIDVRQTLNSSDNVLLDFVNDTRKTTVYLQNEYLPPADTPLFSPNLFKNLYPIQTGLLVPVTDSILNIVGGQALNRGQPVTVTGKRLRLQVMSSQNAGFIPQGVLTPLAVSRGQIFLIDAYSTDNTDQWQVSTLDGVIGVLQIMPVNLLLLPSTADDIFLAESAVISDATVTGSITQLSFSQALSRIYDRTTVTVNANTVAASHGETMHEILGSGDSSNPALQFKLMQSPLTYIPSDSPADLGRKSTLQVWVNNLQWHETDNFQNANSNDRVFTTRLDNSGKALIQFGDGYNGARPPTGINNVTARYRKGIGASGMVKAGQLSQLLDRPQGVKSVSNPDSASGGADPDTSADARSSAPLHVLTLGRVVSLDDYQNFALAFAGISKALATWSWAGRNRAVFVSVAGINGVGFKNSDSTMDKLSNALQQAGNPSVPVTVASYQQVLFEIGVNLKIDLVNYVANEVSNRVWLALSAAFDFQARQLGQGVTQSEIITIIQQTPGVLAVELNAFNRRGEVGQSPLPAVIQAASPQIGQNLQPRAAEMLLLDPASRANIGVWS